jgi:CheY-like chemotaxis protein
VFPLLSLVLRIARRWWRGKLNNRCDQGAQSIGKSNGLFHGQRAPPLLAPRTTGRFPNPAPSGRSSYAGSATGLLRENTASNGHRALAHLQAHRYDLILCNLWMPELAGPDFYAILSRQDASLRQRVLFRTGDTLGAASTYITGQDQCGTQHLPGIFTPLPQTQDNQDTITQNGNPQVTGSPAIQYSGVNVNVATLVQAFKSAADATYTFASNTTVTGMSWGTPTAGATQTSALACAESHVVYYNMGGTSLKLSGGTQGCGLLLVDGDLELPGGVAWYGPILVTGAIIYTGGGNKNITGALLAGSSVTADVIGGNATILNCSAANTNVTANSPLLRLTWQQL